MGEKRAAPLLAKHLNDPANSTDDVKRAALALEKLATPSELEELETFLALYRATAPQRRHLGGGPCRGQSDREGGRQAGQGVGGDSRARSV